jgi:hypothetical protein
MGVYLPARAPAMVEQDTDLTRGHCERKLNFDLWKKNNFVCCFSKAIIVIFELQEAFKKIGVFQIGEGIREAIRNIDTEVGCQLSIMYFEPQNRIYRGLVLERVLRWSQTGGFESEG